MLLERIQIRNISLYMYLQKDAAQSVHCQCGMGSKPDQANSHVHDSWQAGNYRLTRIKEVTGDKLHAVTDGGPLRVLRPHVLGPPYNLQSHTCIQSPS